jgi:hypothetical protein
MQDRLPRRIWKIRNLKSRPGIPMRIWIFTHIMRRRVSCLVMVKEKFLLFAYVCLSRVDLPFCFLGTESAETRHDAKEDSNESM